MEEEPRLINLVINASRDWNDGYGLIVPEFLAEKLEKLGFTEGYSISKSLITNETRRNNCTP